MINIYIFEAIIIFLLGLVFGSFFNVCIYRIPNEESIIKPPSHCGLCGTRLKALDMIPVLSFIFLKGKCRYCGAKFSFRYAIVEILTAISYLFLYMKFGLSWDFVAFTYFASLLIIVFFIDMDHLIIPNGLVLLGIIGGIITGVINIFKPFLLYGNSNWWNPLLGALIGSGFLFLIIIIGIIVYKSDEVMGMGDVKIFIPIGLFLGYKETIVALLLSFIIAGFWSFILIITKKKSRKSNIPFGPFIAIATYITILYGNDILTWYLSRLP